MKWNRSEIIIFIGLIILGALLRLVLLDKYPLGFHGDEGWTGIEARHILSQGFIGLWSPSALGQVSLVFYWTALLFKFFGESISVARFSFAILNVLWIPFFYLTVRSLFSKKIAIIATLLLITAYAPLAFSRRADFIAVNFAFFPSLYFFVKALKNKKAYLFLTAGIMLGLNHYLYASFWITPLAFLIYLLYEMKVRKKIFFIEKGYLGLLALGYLIISLPIIYFAVTHQDQFFSRTKMVSIFSSHSYPIYKTADLKNKFLLVGDNLKETFLMFNYSNDPDIWNIFSRRPVLDFATGVFFLIGFLIGLKNIREKSYFLLYLLFLLFLVMSALTIDSPSYRRAQPSIYISYVYAALGINFVYDFIKKFNKRISLILFILTISGISFYNAYLYFAKLSQSAEAKYILCYQLVKAAQTIKDYPLRIEYVYFYSQRWSYNYETLKFLLNGFPGEDRSKEFGSYSLADTNLGKNVAYIFLPEYADSLAEVKTLYPGGRTIYGLDSQGGLLYTAYIKAK